MIFLLSCAFSPILSAKNLCNVRLAETYGIISNKEPTKESLIVCPKAEASCCPSYEQYKLYKMLEEELKPQINVYNKLLRK
jgi:hypothetical protein